jgi:hypothetical protein
MSSSAAPAVIDKHAEMLMMVNKCNQYKCTSVRKAQSHVNKEKSKFSHFFVLVTQHSGAHVLHALQNDSDRRVS